METWQRQMQRLRSLVLTAGPFVPTYRTSLLFFGQNHVCALLHRGNLANLRCIGSNFRRIASWAVYSYDCHNITITLCMLHLTAPVAAACLLQRSWWARRQLPWWQHLQTMHVQHGNSCKWEKFALNMFIHVYVMSLCQSADMHKPDAMWIDELLWVTCLMYSTPHVWST